MVNPTSEESTFGNYENLEVKLGELEVKATGRNTTEVLMNLMRNAVELEITPSSKEKYFHYKLTKGRVNFEETRQLFLNNVLTETLDDGTPAYYNSNILGRYYRKDYGSDSDQSD